LLIYKKSDTIRIKGRGIAKFEKTLSGAIRTTTKYIHKKRENMRLKTLFQISQIAVLMALVAVLSGCATGAGRGEAEAGRLLELRPMILSGLRPSDIPPGWMVFRSEAQWNEFWLQHSFKPAPEVDFGQYTLVVIFLGQKPNPGYSVKIVEAREFPEKVVVRAVQSEPAPDRLYAQVIVHPYDAVLIRRTEKQIDFATVMEDNHL